MKTRSEIALEKLSKMSDLERESLKQRVISKMGPKPNPDDEHYQVLTHRTNPPLSILLAQVGLNGCALKIRSKLLDYKEQYNLEIPKQNKEPWMDEFERFVPEYLDFAMVVAYADAMGIALKLDFNFQSSQESVCWIGEHQPYEMK